MKKELAPLSPPLRSKLAKIIPRLASPSDSEVLASVRAMDRLLRSEKMSFHELAAAVIVERTVLQVVEAKPRQHHPIVELCEQCLVMDDISEKERMFLKSIRSAFIINENYPLSQKQAKWLIDILNRLEKAA